MMQLIVLGQVPGTHFQLTLFWYTLLVLLVSAVIAGLGLYIHSLRTRRKLQETLHVISLSSLDRA